MLVLLPCVVVGCQVGGEVQRSWPPSMPGLGWARWAARRRYQACSMAACCASAVVPVASRSARSAVSSRWTAASHWSRWSAAARTCGGTSRKAYSATPIACRSVRAAWLRSPDEAPRFIRTAARWVVSSRWAWVICGSPARPIARPGCCWSAFMTALPSVAGWLAASAGGGPPAGALAPGIGQALMGTGRDRAGAGLFGLVGALPLPGLDPGLHCAAGDGGGTLLGEQLVLLKPRADHPGGQRLDLFPPADPPPLLGQRGADRPGEARVQRHELADLLGAHSARGWRRPDAGLVAVGSGLVGAWHPGRRADAALPTAAGGAAKLAAGRALLLADGAVAAGATAVLQRPLIALGGARPHPGQPEPDPGLGDHLQQPGGATVAAGLLRHTIIEVVGVAGVVAGVLVALLEVQQVHPTPRRSLPVGTRQGQRSMPVGRWPLACGRRRAGRDPARGGGDRLSAHRDLPVRLATAARPG